MLLFPIWIGLSSFLWRLFFTSEFIAILLSTYTFFSEASNPTFDSHLSDSRIILNVTAIGAPCNISWLLSYFTLYFLNMVYSFAAFISLKNAVKVPILRATLKTQWGPTEYSYNNWLNATVSDFWGWKQKLIFLPLSFCPTPCLCKMFIVIS
jgi:hypothetical protein